MDLFEQYLLQRIIRVQELKDNSNYHKVMREPQMLQLIQDVLDITITEKSRLQIMSLLLIMKT